MTKISVSCISLLIALLITLLSVLIERNGPEVAAYGNLCGPDSNSDCLELVLKGGFPFAYLFDAPGVSVEHKLSFEDVFEPNAFVKDLGFYFAAMLGLVAAFRNLTRRKRLQ